MKKVGPLDAVVARQAKPTNCFPRCEAKRAVCNSKQIYAMSGTHRSERGCRGELVLVEVYDEALRDEDLVDDEHVQCAGSGAPGLLVEDELAEAVDEALVLQLVVY